MADWQIVRCCNSVSLVKSGDAQTSANDGAPDSARGLAGALHEVSNALTVVLGWLDSARTQMPPGSLREALEVAYSHARRGHKIARQAIGAEVDETALTRSAVSLARDAAVAVAPEAKRAGVGVEIDDGQTTDLLVQSAPVALQVLINLLLNAIHFSKRGKAVTLKVKKAGSHMVFDVIDSGHGIAPERAETLFAAAESTRQGGAGIGLRHSHRLAATHGGQLALTSTGRQGSCFTLTWPVGDAPSGTLHRSVPPPASLDGKRLLVLEDDAAVLALVEFGLTARGAQVASVSSPEELDLALQRGVFDLALVDLSPIADDPERALAHIAERLPGVPVVIISGAAAPNVDASRVAAWVRKPFEIGELTDALCRVLSGE